MTHPQIHRADRRANESRALISAVPADGLADKCRDKRANNAEDRGENESGRIIVPRREKPRDYAGDEADQDDPDDAHRFRSIVTPTQL